MVVAFFFHGDGDDGTRDPRQGGDCEKGHSCEVTERGAAAVRRRCEGPQRR